MKWLKQAILVILILLTNSPYYPQSMLITNIYCNVFPQLNIVDKIYKSKNDYLQIDVTIPQIIGLVSEDKEKNINDLIVNWTEEWIHDVEQIADEYFENGTPPLNQYQLMSKYKVTNLDNIISFYIDYYQYTGGAHGETIRQSYNIDKATGEILNLKDIFKPNYNYKDKIDLNIKNHISKNPEIYFSGKEGFNGVNEKTKFYIDDGNLVIYYGEYEIAPYVTGISEFHIPINIFEENLKYDRI